MKSACLRAFLLTVLSLALFTAAPAAAKKSQGRANATLAIPPGKLGDEVVPKAYRLDLTVDPSKERFSGRVEIDVELKEATPVIFLHGHNLLMRKSEIRIAGQTVVGTWRQADPTGVSVLSFSQPLTRGPAMLSFEYDAPFNTGPAGMFRVKVGNDWYSWTQLQSIDARAVFPSFDQPSFKTPFTVTLRTPPGLAAISNAPEVSVTSEGKLDVHRYAPTLPLPTYLVAMMVGPFTMVSGEVPPTPQRKQPLPLRIVSTRENAGKLDFALEGSKQIVMRLEDYFGDAFPYPKLDQITSPIMPGAMENAGADLYDDALIVMDRNAPTPQKRRFGMVVSHELAHQWFGDLVTPAWWDDIWLNESFANWMGYRIGEEWRPDLNIGAGALAEGFAAMETDTLIAGRPIRQDIRTNSEIDAAFDRITYGKGGHVVAMIAAFMGDAKFREGVRRYMAAHRYGNATSTEFFTAMAEAAGDPRIVPAMRSFIDQQGVPLLTFAHEGEGYVVTQSRYMLIGQPPDMRWGVPMCLRRGEERKCELLTDQSMHVTMPGSGPLIPNAGGTGYYRFELPRDDWNALIASADKLTGGEAQALTDSLASSVITGRAGTDQLAALARKLVNHPDSYAADSALDALASIVGAGMADDEARRSWRRFVWRIYRPLADRFGLDPRAGAYANEDSEIAQRRVQVIERLALIGRDAPTRTRLAKAADAFMAGDVAALDPAWFGIAFDIRLGDGEVLAARALMDKALASEDPVFRPTALSAIAESGSLKIARWLLAFDDARLRPSEKRDLLSGVMQTNSTRELGYAWVKKNLDKLLDGGGGIFYAARFPQMFNRFCSVDRADQLARDLRPRFAGKPGALELERTLERVRNCGILRNRRAGAIAEDLVKLR